MEIKGLRRTGRSHERPSVDRRIARVPRTELHDDPSISVGKALTVRRLFAPGWSAPVVTSFAVGALAVIVTSVVVFLGVVPLARLRTVAVLGVYFGLLSYAFLPQAELVSVFNEQLVELANQRG